jgi:sec-independent protein translocase protein TatB
MFDIGWSEILLIGVVALIVIGPKELPGVLRTMGQGVTKLRRMAAEFQGQFNEALREAELHDLKKDVDDLRATAASLNPLNVIRNEVEQIQQSVGNPFEGVAEDEASRTVASSSTPATTTPAAASPAPPPGPAPQSVPAPQPAAQVTSGATATAPATNGAHSVGAQPSAAPPPVPAQLANLPLPEPPPLLTERDFGFGEMPKPAAAGTAAAPAPSAGSKPA